MKISLHTLGCKVNQCETETIAADLRSRGYEIVPDGSFADVYVINTCMVTQMAERKSRQYIRRAKKANPECKVVVTGCYAEVCPKELSMLDGVDIVLGNRDKAAVADHIFEHLKMKPSCAGEISKTEKTRAFIKIQDGCDRFCAYCIVPYARGKPKSRPLEDITHEARKLISGGFNEIVLTGINTALYGSEEGFSENCGLDKVIKEINGIPGDFRIRLSSLEPTVIDAAYVKKLFKYEKLCRHLHLSLQSGSDRILGLMNRRYNIEEYMQIIRALKAFDPLYGISTDVIAGFPGESDEDFAESIDVIKRARFCKVHVFKYSARKGTAAAEMEGVVSEGKKAERGAALKAEGDKSQRRFFESNIGQAKRVLIEEYIDKAGCYTGFTDNYIKIYIKNDYALGYYLNKFINVKPVRFRGGGMEAEIIRGE